MFDKGGGENCMYIKNTQNNTPHRILSVLLGYAITYPHKIILAYS